MPAQQFTTDEVRNCILDAVLSFVDLGRGEGPPGQASQARWPCAEHIPGHAPVNSGHAVGDHAAGRDSAATDDAAYRPTRRYPDATDDAAHHGSDPPAIRMKPAMPLFIIIMMLHAPTTPCPPSSGCSTATFTASLMAYPYWSL